MLFVSRDWFSDLIQGIAGWDGLGNGWSGVLTRIGGLLYTKRLPEPNRLGVAWSSLVRSWASAADRDAAVANDCNEKPIMLSFLILTCLAVGLM